MATTLQRSVRVSLRRLFSSALLIAMIAYLSFGMVTSAHADEPAISTTQSEELQPEPQPNISAQLSNDERFVILKAEGASLTSAHAVNFNVWSERGGNGSLVQHGAVRLSDGSWMATIYIASPTPLEPGVPYNCNIDGAVHRLYDPATGQHLFTKDVNEADTLSRIGWNYEGVAWVEDGNAESSSASELPPVYRLHNPLSGEHLYTLDRNEYDSLPHYGWQQEGLAFYSDPEKAQPIYRLFNPNAAAGAHHFTSNAYEYAILAQQGWNQEGICWYGAASNGDGSWSLMGGNQPHNDAGLYHVEAVASFIEDGEPGVNSSDSNSPTVPNGLDDGNDPDDKSEPAQSDGNELTTPDPAITERSIGQTTFTVTTPSATAAVANIDNENGAFDIIIGNIRSVSGIASVQVPVWATANQEDIIWYQAEPQADGSYKATLRVADHRLLRHYNVHVYLRTGNGILENVAQTSAELELSNCAIIDGGPNTYTVSIINIGPVSRVQMPMWSDANGQDDLTWYDAAYTPESNSWTATISTNNLLDSGWCPIHIYVDGQLRKAIGLNVTPAEILTLRQRAIINAAQSTPTLGGGLCAGWVSTVLLRAGQPYNLADDACDMYYRLPYADRSQLLPGMVVGVSTHGHTIAGSIWGHVGIYLGDGVVIDDVGYVRRSSLDWWMDWYSDRVPVRFGFLEY